MNYQDFEMGLVSTIIPVHNRADLIREAVESILAQQYRPIEIIIVDDGSTDHTPQVLDQLAALHPEEIRYVVQTNGGPGLARQRGLDRARGEFIQFLDSDDLLLPEKFAAQVKALRDQPDCQICYGCSWEEDHSFSPPRRQGPMRATGEVRQTLFPELLLERWWTTSTPLYRKILLDRIGPWQGWINEEDWEYDARAGATGARLAWVPVPVSIRRIHLGDDHLSHEGCLDPRKLRDRAQAQASIYRSALQAGVAEDSPEMRRFARSAFLLCRQCGEAGLSQPSRDLFQLSCRATAGRLGLRPDLVFYACLASVLGWSRTARWSVQLRSGLGWALRRLRSRLVVS